MKTVNTLTQQRIRFTLFPDNQPHIDLLDVAEGDDVEVVIRLNTSVDVLHLLQIADALDNIGARKASLVITYLMAARYDRSMRFGDSVDLRVIAKLINSCGFAKVLVFDVHSDTALALIDRSRNISNQVLVEAYDKPNAILICPDAGAVKKVEKYSFWNPRIKNVVHCVKKRNLNTGTVQLTLLDPHDDCVDENCVVIDDICDGGATFLAIAGQVVKPKTLTLIVSHGIFSKGLRQLKERYTEIITTDSFAFQNPEPQLRVIKLYGN